MTITGVGFCLKQQYIAFYCITLLFSNIGVPQGSILGPILFIIYISDMSNAVRHGTSITFADDTTILLQNKSFEDLYINAYESLISILDYFNCNKLTINLLKTNYIFQFDNSVYALIYLKILRPSTYFHYIY